MIEEATLEGIVTTRDGKRALLRFADGRAYSVRSGDRFYDGHLVSIDEKGLDFMIDTASSSGSRPYRLAFPGTR